MHSLKEVYVMLEKVQVKLLASGLRLEREKQVLSRFPVSRATWWRGVKSGQYPQPIKLTARTTVWRSEDIDNLIARVSGGAT